jgi:TPR repeat protein
LSPTWRFFKPSLSPARTRFKEITNWGLSYLHGLGVSKDKNKAFEWFEKAAKQGLSYAQSELAML